MVPFVIAHRGDSAHRPENTLASFASALESGTEIMELDVQLTRDGHVIVIHDPTLDRTTSGRGQIREMTLTEIRGLSAGYPARFGDAYRGERVPTLAEALAFLRERSRPMIELKSDSVTDDADGGLEALTIEEIRRAGMERESALISFSRRALLRCRKEAPEILRGHLFHGASPEQVVEGARAVGTDLVMPEKGMLTDALFEQTRAASLRVATWVLDEPEELQALARFELYGFASNRPAVMMDAVRERA
jgi:glycerophosphoryl diester phosphodiesterase